jgi:hypothetical protein
VECWLLGISRKGFGKGSSDAFYTANPGNRTLSGKNYENSRSGYPATITAEIPHQNFPNLSMKSAAAQKRLCSVDRRFLKSKRILERRGGKIYANNKRPNSKHKCCSETQEN